MVDFLWCDCDFISKVLSSEVIGSALRANDALFLSVNASLTMSLVFIAKHKVVEPIVRHRSLTAVVASQLGCCSIALNRCCSGSCFRSVAAVAACFGSLLAW